MNKFGTAIKGGIVAILISLALSVVSTTPFAFMVQTGGAGVKPVKDTRIINNTSTGLNSGGLLQQASATTVDISAGTGVMVDDFTDPENPVIINVEWDDFDGITPAFLNTAPTTAIGIDNTGALVQRAITFTTEEFRDFILIGVAVHPDFATVSNVDNRTIPSASTTLALNDLEEAVQAINLSGNEFSANGANLKMDKSAGVTHFMGAFWKEDKKNPNQGAIDAVSEIDFFYTWKDGGGGFIIKVPTVTDVIPGSYDDGTGGATLPNGTVASDKWSIQKIFLVGDTDPDVTVNTTVIHFGTNVYDTQLDALNNLQEDFERAPSTDGLQFRAWLIVRGGATDLSDSGDAIFVTADRFGIAPVSISAIVTSDGYDAPIGEVKMFALSETGAVTKGQLQSNGWAIMDGTTPASQGITNPILTTTDDLSDKFIRISNNESSGTTGGAETFTLTLVSMTAKEQAAGVTFDAVDTINGIDTGDIDVDTVPPFYEVAFFIKVK